MVPSDNIDISGLPEGMKKALRQQVHHLRARFGNGQVAKKVGDLPTRRGTVIGDVLTREMIYADNDEQ